MLDEFCANTRYKTSGEGAIDTRGRMRYPATTDKVEHVLQTPLPRRYVAHTMSKN